MAIQWMDFPSGSVGIYGTDASLLLNGIYAASQIFLMEDPDPVVSGTVCRHSTSIGAGVSLRKVLPAATDIVGVAFRNWMDNLPTGAGQDTVSWTLHFRDGSGTQIAAMNFGPAGQIYIRDTLGAVVAESAIDIIKANSWQHIEVKIDFPLGDVLVFINGDEVMNETGVGVGSGDIALVSWERSFNSNVQTFMKDYVIYDGTGGWGTGPLGTVTVYDLSPNGDVSSGWVPSTGTSPSAILDNQPPNDSQYISATDSPLPDPCIVTLSSLPDDVTSVRALMTIVRARKSDGGDGNLQVGLVSDGDVDNGADRAITTAFTYYTDISNIDPATGATWTPTAVDDVQLSIDRTL